MAKLTFKQVSKAIEGSGGIISDIAEKCECDWHTAKTFIDKDEKLTRLLQNEKEGILDLGESRLYQAVDEGEPWAVQYLLTRLGKKRGFGEKQEIELSGSLEQRIKQMTPEEKEKRIKELQKKLITKGNA